VFERVRRRTNTDCLGVALTLSQKPRFSFELEGEVQLTLRLIFTLTLHLTLHLALTLALTLGLTLTLTQYRVRVKG
jgi:hypothetical protein